MTELRKKFLKDKDGSRILPITHMEAVKDSQGNSLTSVLGDFEDTVNASLALKADKATTLAGYGITDGYTKAEGQDLENTVDARLDAQDAEIEMLNGSEVIVGALPASGTLNKIYRVPDDPTSGKYTDYGWDGTQFVPLCTYPNDVDDVPTAGSNNLVKGGGVASSNKSIWAMSAVGSHYSSQYFGLDVMSWVTGYLKKDGTVDSVHSDYKTGSFTNTGTVPTMLKLPPLVRGNDNYISMALYDSQQRMIASTNSDGNILVMVLPGETLKITMWIEYYNDGVAPGIIDNPLKCIFDKYKRSYAIYQDDYIFSLDYSDGIWTVTTKAGHIRIIDDYQRMNDMRQISSGSYQFDLGVSGDPYGAFYCLLLNLSNNTPVLCKLNINDVFSYVKNENYYILGYGSLEEHGRQFDTSFAIKVNGALYKKVYLKNYDALKLSQRRLHVYRTEPLMNIYFNSGSWYIDTYAKYYGTIDEFGNESNLVQLTQETINVGLSHTASDPYGYNYYLIFNLQTRKPTLCTGAEIDSVDFAWNHNIILGYGNLGNYGEYFECSVPITVNGVLRQRSIVKTSDKKVLWIGTSIPAGSTYPTNSCAALNRTCINNARGSSYIRYGISTTPATPPEFDMSLSKKVSEYEAIYRPLVTQGLMTEDTLDFFKSYSYENLILPYLDEVDVIVFDHGYNDMSLIHDEIANPDWNSLDRSTFMGAFNYLMKEIFSRKPFMKVFISTYFQKTTDDVQAPLAYLSDVIEMQEKIAEHFGYPLLDSWKYCPFDGYYVPNTDTYIATYNQQHGTSYTQLWADADGNMKRFQMYCIDGVHPYTDEAKEWMDKVYTHLLNGLL